MTPDQKAALAAARALVAIGIPVFIAQPAKAANGGWDPAGGTGGTGYWLPKRWETFTPSTRGIEAWRPGMALCAVMGHGLDLIDADPRNGFDPRALNGTMPIVYASAATPSGGFHGFVSSLGVRSRDAVLPGVDIKAGVGGEGHGFAFIAPTLKLSKTTGEIKEYRWVEAPDPDKMKTMSGDHSGRKLADIVNAVHGGKRNEQDQNEQSTEAREWMVAATIPRGKRYPWLRSYAGWLREKNVRLGEARDLMRQRWGACEQPVDYPMPWEDAEALLGDIYTRYAPGESTGGTAETGAPAEWQDPTPLGVSYPPPLPVDACGPILGPLVEEVGRALQVPTDLVINMALSVIATAAQGRWAVRVNPDWTEILSISSTSVAASGERKSPILSIMSTDLGDIEKGLREAAAPNVKWRAEQIKLAEDRVSDARKAARKGDQGKEYELQMELEYLEGLTPLHLPRLIADDATPEALLRVLADQDGTIGVLSAEPGFFATLAGRYTNGIANLDGVLKATSGEPIRVDRVGRDPLLIERPCLTVSVCIQPGLLEQLGKSPELRHAGFLARFLYVMPAPMVGKRIVSIKSTSPIKKAFQDYLSINIRSLATYAYSLKQLTQLTELELSPAAVKTLDTFRTTLEPRLHPQTGNLATIADWGSKLPGAAARIAAALTLLSDPHSKLIEEDVMADAIRLADAYIPHAVAVLDGIRGHSDGLDQARDVLGLIQRRGWETFSVRDVTRLLANTGWVKNHKGKATDIVTEQLELLTDYGHIRPIPEEERQGAGRKPSPRFEVNPIHLRKETP